MGPAARQREGSAWRERARIALASIRLFNGTAALVAPAAVARKLGVDPETNAGALYMTRLFGVRTVLIGRDLLRRDEGLRGQALRVAPLIHVTDAVVAVIAGVQRQLPPRAATTAAIISTTNVVLALAARGKRSGRRS
ncbi:MAG: hypothetical protein H0V45_15805 [Actinobacteria bacterium]|nr:hypothetical protein [Actinomycetota bacterium]